MDHCGDDSVPYHENETVTLETMSSSPEILNVQLPNAQIQAGLEATIHSHPESYSGEVAYTQNIIYQDITVDQTAQPATGYQTLQNLQPTSPSPVQVQVQVQQQSITYQSPQPNTSPENSQKPQVRPDPQIQQLAPPNHQKPQICQAAQNNTHHQYPQPTYPSHQSQTSQNNTPTSYQHPQPVASVQSPHIPQPAVSNQNPPKPQPRPPPQQNAPTAYQNPQPTASNQVTYNPQSAPISQDPTYNQATYQQSSTTYQDPTYNHVNAYQQPSTYQDPTYNQANTYQQPNTYQDPTYDQNTVQQDSGTYQDPSLANISQPLEDPQSVLQPEYFSPQDTTFQLTSTYQDHQAVPNNQTPQDPQSFSAQEYSNSQDNAYYEPQQGASPQVSQSCLPDNSAQEPGSLPNDSSQATTHQDSHEASFSQPSQNAQLVDEYAYNNEQSNEYAPTITYYNQDPDNSDPSMLPSGTDQVQSGDEMPDSGFVLADLGAAIGDIGIEGFDGVGDGVASLTEIGTSLEVLGAGARMARSTVNAISGINPLALVNTGIGLANTAVNAVSADPMSAVQAGLGVAMSSVRIAASIGTWNEARQRQKESAARFAATHGPAYPAVNSEVAIATQIDEILLVLSALGQRLVVLEVINLAELPQALVACRTACAQADTGDLLAHFDTLDGTLQYAVTSALFFCAACFPMHIYRGFGTGVLDNFLWGCPVPEFATGQVAGFKSVDRTIAFLKSTPREVQLLTRLPAGLNRIVPTYGKTEKNERRRLKNAHKEFVREIEAKGHPQPRDGSFRVVSWHFPFATWSSPYTFKNAGHSFDECLRWQMDAGRLLHAWTIGGHLDLMHGELMWLPAGVAESLARWLLGLPGMKFKLVPSSAFDYSNLRLKPAVRAIMFGEGFESMKAVRDPQADSCNPVIPRNIFVPAPPSVRRRPIARASHQARSESAMNPLSPHSTVDDGLSAEQGAATNPSGVSQQIIHRQLSHQVGNQQPIAGQDPQNPFSRSGSATPLTSQGSISPRDPQLPHLVAPDLLPHQNLSQPMNQNLAVTNPVAPSIVALPAGAQSIPKQTHRYSTTNIFSDPNRNGQQTSPYTAALGSGIQHHQHPSSSQVPVPTMQASSLQANQLFTQNSPTFNDNLASNSQTPPSYHYNPVTASSQVASSNQVPQIHHQSTPAQSQRTSLNRKPTNASRLRSVGSPANTSPTGPHSAPSNQSPQSPQFHTPTSPVSRTSTTSSIHSSSSRISSAPNLQSDSPDASSLFSAPNAVFTPHSFKVQSQGTIKRRPVPPPPTQPPVLRRVKAIHDFIPEQENELGFKVGEVLDVLNDSSQDGWWEARFKGKTGAIPASYVGDIRN